MTIRGGGHPKQAMVLTPVSRLGPPPRSFAADAHDCIMVRSLWTYRIQGCGAILRARWQAPLGPLCCPTKKITGARSKSALTENAPYKACSAFTRVAACTLALPPIRDTLIEGFSHFVTSMTAPIASGWSGCRVGLAPTGKRRLVTAHTHFGHCSGHKCRPRRLSQVSGSLIVRRCLRIGKPAPSLTWPTHAYY